MEIQRQIRDDVTVLYFAGDLDIYAMPSFHEEFRECMDANTNNIIVNLQQVSALYSSGVGALISYSQQLKKQNRRMLLAAPSHTVMHVLQLMKLQDFFEIFSSEKDAEQSAIH